VYDAIFGCVVQYPLKFSKLVMAITIMSMDDPITRLLTLLNVSATKAGKRKRADEFVPSEKPNRKRKSITFATESKSIVLEEKDTQPIVEAEKIDINDGGDDVEKEGKGV